MRSSPPLPFALSSRTMRWRAAGPKTRRPSPLPTVIPTRSSVLQRLVWWFTPGR